MTIMMQTAMTNTKDYLNISDNKAGWGWGWGEGREKQGVRDKDKSHAKDDQVFHHICKVPSALLYLCVLLPWLFSSHLPSFVLCSTHICTPLLPASCSQLCPLTSFQSDF